VDRRLAERAIAEVLDADGVDGSSQARALAAKRVEQLKGLAPPQQRRRLLAYLARRGFRGHEIQDLVNDVLKGL
jgi:SOS response regulatory protein OraA/RecX